LAEVLSCIYELREYDNLLPACLEHQEFFEMSQFPVGVRHDPVKTAFQRLEEFDVSSFQILFLRVFLLYSAVTVEKDVFESVEKFSFILNVVLRDVY
jgi:hypothetical protein